MTKFQPHNTPRKQKGFSTTLELFDPTPLLHSSIPVFHSLLPDRQPKAQELPLLTLPFPVATCTSFSPNSFRRKAEGKMTVNKGSQNGPLDKGTLAPKRKDIPTAGNFHFPRVREVGGLGKKKK